MTRTAASVLALVLPAAFACAASRGAPSIVFERSPETQAADLPFSDAVRVGELLFLSGQLGVRPGDNKLVPGGIEAETRQSLNNIRDVLRTAGMDLKDVASVTVYITSFADFARFNAVYREYFPTDPPARATVQVAALNDGAHVELQMIAVVP